MPTSTVMARIIIPPPDGVPARDRLLRLRAATSLWRSRLVNAVSIGTIAVSLFVLGAFLTVASGLGEMVTRWTEKVQVIVYLEDGIEDRVRASLENRLREDPRSARWTS